MQTRIATRETTKRTAKRTGRMGAAMVVTNHVGAQQKRGWGRVEEDGEGLVAEPVALYLEEDDERALLRVSLRRQTARTARKVLAHVPAPSFQSIFCQISTAPIDN